MPPLNSPRRPFGNIAAKPPPYKAAPNSRPGRTNTVGAIREGIPLSPLKDSEWGLPYQAAYDAVLERRKDITIEKIRLRILIMEVAANAEFRAAEIIGATPNTVEGQKAVREARRWRVLDRAEGEKWSNIINKRFDRVRLERIEAARERVGVPGQLQKALKKVLAQIMIFSNKCPDLPQTAVSPPTTECKENLPVSGGWNDDSHGGRKNPKGEKVCTLASLRVVKFGRVRRPSSRFQF